MEQQKRGLRGLVRPVMLAVALLVLFTMAAPAQADDADLIAGNFLKLLRSDKAVVSTETLAGNLLNPLLPPVNIGSLFRLEGGGYILVSPDRSISPVKAYSLVSDFDALPEPYRRALLAELELRVRTAAADTTRRVLTAGTTDTVAQWDFLLQFDATRMPLTAYLSVPSLLQTRWNQGYPYNKFLPAVGGQTVLAGCVNVAVGQVLRYYKYPLASKGVISYLWDAPPPTPLQTILYRNYNWDNMPPAVDAATAAYQADEVALLMKDLGIANHTAFGVGDSATYFQAGVLTDNFGYSTSLAHMDNSDYAGFITTLQEEFVAGRPVLLTFPGHMTVADGYADDATGTKIHVNMGWGGSVDDYYYLNQPVPPDPLPGIPQFPTGPSNLDIYYNIKPCNVSDCAVNLETGDTLNGLTITGNFNWNWDADRYEVYLKGPTTFSADRGYSNMAFYVSILNVLDGSVIFPSPDPYTTQHNTAVVVDNNLPAGKYAVRVSPCADNGSCFPLASTPDHYTVTLNTGALSAAEIADIDSKLVMPPVINNIFADLVLNTAGPAQKILIDARNENGAPVTLSVGNSNPAAVSTVLNGNILTLTPTGTAKVASRIVVTATANGKVVEKSFTVMTDNGATAFGTTFTVGGTFTGQNDVETSLVILDGACTITGSRAGISNQAFFSSVVNGAGNTVASANGIDVAGSTMSVTVSRGVYRLQATLCKGGCYPGNTGDPFAFTVDCPTADSGTATIAALLGIDLSGATLIGDLNADNVVNLADAVLLLQLLNGVDMTGTTLRLRADLNGDGRIGPAEAIYILQKAAGLR